MGISLVLKDKTDLMSRYTKKCSTVRIFMTESAPKIISAFEIQAFRWGELGIG